MRHVFAFVVFAISCNVARSQAPTVLKGLFGEDRLAEPIIILKSLTPQQRMFLMSGLEKVPEGYLRVNQSEANIHVLRQFFQNRNVGPNAPLIRAIGLSPTDKLPKGISFVGALVENPSRVDYLLKQQGGAHIMLTIWDLKASGSQTVVAAEAFNQTVAGNPAILTLAVAPRVQDCLWKVLWWQDAISFEFYLTDRLTLGRPDRKPQEVVEMAANIASSAVHK